MNAKDILMVFAKYGLKKTSMEDVAKSAGVSRQAIYKRFGSKDGVLSWVLTTYIDELYRAASHVITVTGDEKPSERVLQVFQLWCGEVVPIVGVTDHGGEILEYGMQFADLAEKNWQQRLFEQLAQYMVDESLASSNTEALEQINLFNVAAKGLLLQCQSVDQFSVQMKRIVDVVYR